MRLKKISIFVFGLAFFGAGINSCLAAFSDVPTVQRYSTAINYLSEAGIIDGYPDGTFQPDRTVNRAEFLKLVLESSGIPADVTTESGFDDIDESAWYACYVRKALYEGWIEGYPDGTFRPENGITKAEGLKIIGKAQQWQVSANQGEPPFADTPADAWFTPYVYYAKSRNFLDESGRFFIPDTILSRGKTSEILFRTYAASLNGEQAYSSKMTLSLPQKPPGSELPASPLIASEPVLDFTPVDFEIYPASFFSNISLNEPFPNNFYLNEVYFFEGSIQKGSFNKTFIFLAPENETDTSKFLNYVGSVTGGKFSIPVYFRKPGNYRLGLILGSSGESKIIHVSILPSLPWPFSGGSAGAPADPQIEFSNQETVISWDSNGNDLIRLLVFQDRKVINFIFRQETSRFDLPYEDFTSFKQGPVYFKVEGTKLESGKPLKILNQWTAGVTAKFNAIQHHFSEFQKDKINISSLPETYTDRQIFHFTGLVKTDIFNEAVVTRPDGQVDAIKLSSSKPFGSYYGSQTIPVSNDFSFSYKPELPGTYFIEINNSNGEAVLNHPVYPSTDIPLLPDFFDLNQYGQKETNYDLSAFRSQMLNLINKERQSKGFEPVTLDPALNNLAQLHSEDMVQRFFFGHINPDNETPNDRRIEMNIPMMVGENLAQSPTVLYAHYGLMRSGIHLENILNPKWTRVGIGFAQDENGQLLTTEEFSTNPLTEIDLMNIKGEILDGINNQRRSIGIPLIESDSVLSEIADSWSAKMADEKFFDFVSPDGELLSENVQKQMQGRTVQAVILESSDQEKLKQEILEGDDAVKNQWRKAGIGLKVDNIGSLKATLLYTTY